MKCRTSKSVKYRIQTNQIGIGLGHIQSVTIIKENDEYYASVLTLSALSPKQQSYCNKTGNQVGIDLGISTLMTLSNGISIENLKFSYKSQKKIARLQRSLARKPRDKDTREFSKNHEKSRKRLTTTYQKIRRQREDYLQKITTKIIKSNDTICMENLNVDGMMKNRHLARSIGDASFNMIQSLLQYKCKRYDKQSVIADTFFPSSKRCSHCGHVLSELSLDVRKCKCPICNTTHDRDINASINILQEGLRILATESVA